MQRQFRENPMHAQWRGNDAAAFIMDAHLRDRTLIWLLLGGPSVDNDDCVVHVADSVASCTVAHAADWPLTDPYKLPPRYV
jgi:hypothetical protein